MATHNFQIFDSNSSNMTTDASYANDTTRINGAQNHTIADPYSFNKSVHQATMMATAIAQYMSNNGISCDDTNLNNLISALTQTFVAMGMITYGDRAAHGLFGAADVGRMSLCASQRTPSPATYTASGNGNLLGQYHYREVLISGYKNLDGTYFVNGFAPADTRDSFDVSPQAQKVVITNLPIGDSGCIGRAIYRSAADGNVGAEKFCGAIMDNTTTAFTDNMVDSQLGTNMPKVQGTAIPADVPESNTTGSSLDVSQIMGGVSSATFAGVPVPKVGQQLQIPFSLFNNADVKNISSATSANLKTVSEYGYYRILDGSGFIDSPFPKLAYEDYHPFMMLVIPVDGTRVLQTAFSLYQCGDIKQRLVYSSTRATSWYPKFDDYSTSQHWCIYADGRQHQWGTFSCPVTITSPYGNIFQYKNFEINLPIKMENNNPNYSSYYYVPSIHISANSPGNLIPASPRWGSQTSIVFNILSPCQVNSLPVIFNYSIWCRNVHQDY